LPPASQPWARVREDVDDTVPSEGHGDTGEPARADAGLGRTARRSGPPTRSIGGGRIPLSPGRARPRLGAGRPAGDPRPPGDGGRGRAGLRRHLHRAVAPRRTGAGPRRLLEVGQRGPPSPGGLARPLDRPDPTTLSSPGRTTGSGPCGSRSATFPWSGGRS
jgi:hypothetical protein